MQGYQYYQGKVQLSVPKVRFFDFSSASPSFHDSISLKSHCRVLHLPRTGSPSLSRTLRPRNFTMAYRVSVLTVCGIPVSGNMTIQLSASIPYHLQPPSNSFPSPGIRDLKATVLWLDSSYIARCLTLLPAEPETFLMRLCTIIFVLSPMDMK